MGTVRFPPHLPPSSRSWRRAAMVLLALLVAGSQAGRAADPVTYAVTLAPSGVAELDAALPDLSLLQTLRESAPVDRFHDKHDVGPFQQLGRDRHLRIVAQTR